ncbi:MAG: anaerobic ribonucleoside-triphosphate reductase [Nitrososphaerales archaeon]
MQNLGATKRIKAIYSVIANLNRLEILKILNSHSPLTYSELKSLSGFKSKKESGKFAYHLRKLVRQNLVSLDRAQRKYIISNLGRSILNLNRQIEEQTLFESGKLYVRTSRHRIEPFNPDKILQSLVKEADMPLELAQRITNEIESRLPKIQTHYLTAPLIREIVNALLIEQGLEVYRQRLTRLGKPVYDVSELISSTGSGKWAMDELKDVMAGSILAEYLLLIQLTKDIADLHFSGDIHLSKINSWSFLPDTAFVNLNYIFENGFSLDSKIPSLPRIDGKIKDFKELIKVLCHLTSLLSREINSEVCFTNLDSFLQKNNINVSEGDFCLLFELLSSTLPQSSDSLIVSFFLREENLKLLKEYEKYNSKTPNPKVVLILPFNLLKKNPYEFNEALAHGIPLALANEEIRSYRGIKHNSLSNGVKLFIHSLSINLPRIGYAAGKDEIYFRAKFYITLQNSVSALKSKKKLITENLNRNLLPFLSLNYREDSISSIVNLIGLEEAGLAVLGNDASVRDFREFSKRFVEGVNKLANDLSLKVNEKINIGFMEDEASTRFFNIDQEKYGKHLDLNKKSYCEGISLQGDLIDSDALDWAEWMLKNVSGGCYLALKLKKDERGKIVNFITSEINKLIFARFQREINLCQVCGFKTLQSFEKCSVCGFKLQPVIIS